MATKISKIEKEFILKSLESEGSKLRLQCRSHHRLCHIVGLVDQELSLFSEKAWDGFQTWDKVSGYLSYKGQSIAFSSKVRKVDGKTLKISEPDSFCRGLERKFARIQNPRGIEFKFFLKSGEFSLNFPLSQEYSEVVMPSVNENFDASSINSLIESFLSKAKAQASEACAKMFRKTKPESLEELLICKYGKTLYIPSTISDLPANDPFPEGRLITKEIEEEYEGTEIFLSGSRMEKLLKEKALSGLHSEIWVPILYYQYVVGYVYLCNKDDRQVSLDLNAVSMAYEFSQILAFMLKTNNYFSDQAVKKERTAIHAAVIDVSASGLMVSLPKDSSELLLKNQSVLDVEYRLASRSYRVQARIVRRYESDKSIFYGMQFTSMEFEQKRSLYEYLYSEEYDPLRETDSEASLSGAAQISDAEQL